MGTTVWIVTGTNGEYSDRSWWGTMRASHKRNGKVTP